MPRSLTLVRHGESEGNLVRTLYENNNPHPNEAQLMQVHTSERRLTPTGVEQAKTAGAWLRRHWAAHIPQEDQCLFVSPYVRAIETAGNFGFGTWRMDNRIVERNWGQLDMLTYDERRARFGEAMDYNEDVAFFWRPSDGETLQDVIMRERDFLRSLHEQCKDKHVLAVCHGEAIWAFRTILERWTSHDLVREMREYDSRTRPSNCRIVHYTRDSDSHGKGFTRVRFIHPMHPNDETRNLDWQPIGVRHFTDKELREFASTFERHLTE